MNSRIRAFGFLLVDLVDLAEPLSWLDGSDVSYANWAEEPLPGAACAHIRRHSAFQWEATDNCSQEFYFVCEFGEFSQPGSLVLVHRRASFCLCVSVISQTDVSVFQSRVAPWLVQTTMPLCSVDRGG